MALNDTLKRVIVVVVKVVVYPVTFTERLTEKPFGKASMIFTIVGAFSVNANGSFHLRAD